MIKVSRYRWVLFSIIIAIFYWFLESLIDALLFFEAGFWMEAFNPGPYEVWMRSILIIFILGFGVFAQYSINKLKDSEERIKAERKKWEKTFDAVPEIVALISPNFEILKINETGAQILGMDKEEIIGKKCYKVIHNQDKPIDACPCEKVIETEEADVGEEFENEGRRYIAAGAPILNENDEIEAIVHTAKDITDRKLAEERFQKLFDASPDPTYYVDKEGVFREVNEAGVELLGYEKKEITGKSLSEAPFFPSESEEKIIENFKKRLKGAKIPPYAVEAKTKDGETLTVVINGALLEGGGENVGVIGIARNITERERAIERKEFLNTLLRQDLGSKSQTIRGYLQLIGEEVDLPEEQKKYLRKAMEAGRESDEILGLAKKLGEIEETELAGEKDIVKVLKGVIDDISGFVEREGVEIERGYPEKIGKVEGDYSLNIVFSQILLTRIQMGGCSKIRINAREREEDVLIRIEDDGEPLPEDIKSMFSGEPYTGETTGVGGVRYYMIRQIAEHNKAEIEVQDSEPDGARFDVYLQKA